LLKPLTAELNVLIGLSETNSKSFSFSLPLVLVDSSLHSALYLPTFFMKQSLLLQRDAPSKSLVE
jgi:hypothetical protein